MNKRKALLVSAGVLSIGVAGLGINATTSALSGSSSDDPMSSVIDKLVSKFQLDKSEVQAVFDEARSEHYSEMKAKREAALQSALDKEKISQAQYDHIVNAWKKMDALHSEDRSDGNREKIHSLMQELRTWMEEQAISRSDIGMPSHAGKGMHHRGGMH